MLKTASFLGAAAIVAVGTTAALAAELEKGVVKKVDTKAGEATIIQEEPINPDTPAMTTVFRTVDPALLETTMKGDTIDFVDDRMKGKLTVTELR